MKRKIKLTIFDKNAKIEIKICFTTQRTRGYNQLKLFFCGRKRSSAKIIFTCYMVFFIVALLTGCNFQGPLTQTVKQIEAGSSAEPLELVALSGKDAEKYTVEVVENALNVNVPGKYDIKYMVNDISGAEAKEMTFSFTVVDTTPPVIKANDTVVVILGNEFDASSFVSVSDIVDGIIDSKNVIVNGSLDTKTVGTYPVTLTVSDKAGNKASKTLTVKVAKPDVFFENLTDGLWLNAKTNIAIRFYFENDRYHMAVTYHQTDNGSIGEITNVRLNEEQTTAAFDCDFIDFWDNTYSMKTSVTVNKQKLKDNKISADYGDGMHEYKYLKE